MFDFREIGKHVNDYKVRGITVISLTAALTGICGAVTLPPMPIPQLPQIPSTIIDVTKHGVKADGSTDNATVLQKLIDSISAAGGGVIDFPSNSSAYVSGPIVLKDHINFRVESGAMVKILPYSKYKTITTKAPAPSGNDTTYYPHWMTASGATDIEISGRGTIEGDNSAWMTAFEANSKMPHRPYMIRLENVTRLHVHQITLQNSPMFHIMMIGKEMTADSLKITAGTDTHNTDGIDPAGENILIYDCNITVGDDNIAVKPYLMYCKAIHIRNCTFGTGHGLSIGGQTTFGMDGMLVERCTFNGTENGFRLKANRGDGGVVKNLVYRNCTMTKVTNPIYFDSNYKTSSAKTNIPFWKNIIVDSVTSTNSTAALHIVGLTEAPVDSVYFTNCTFSAGSCSFSYAHNIFFYKTTVGGKSDLAGMKATSGTDVTAFLITVPPVSTAPRTVKSTMLNAFNLNQKPIAISINGQKLNTLTPAASQVVVVKRSSADINAHVVMGR